MRLIGSVTFVAALLSLYQIVRLPYTAGICCLVAFAVLAYVGHIKKVNLILHTAFSGLVILSGVMAGYHADVKGVGGTTAPELILAGIGMSLIAFEELRPAVRR